METQSKIENLGNAWPFPQTKTYEEYAARGIEHRAHWRETSETRFDEFLNVLPPIYAPHGFFVGEPAIHDERGVAVHSLFVHYQGRYFVRDVALDGAALAIEELDAALACEIGRTP